MNPAVPRAAPAAKPRRRWRQLLLQFNLQSLLGLTTLSAVVCWWYLRPEIAREELADKYLTLQRQTRLVDPSTLNRSRSLSPTILPRRTYFGPASVTTSAGKLVPVNDGSWQLRDEHNHLLASGSCAADQAHGRWTIYHTSGRKAADGQMVRGTRVGLWRTWNEHGQHESEVTYTIVKRELPQINYPQANCIWGCGNVIPPRFVRTGKKVLVEDSSRHDPTRIWHPNGKLKAQGSYKNDLRYGPWSFYDDRGLLTESGEYHHGLREGPWKVSDSATGASRVAQFIAGRPQEEFDRLVAQIQLQLASGDLGQQIVAIDRLEALGRAGARLFIDLLDSADSTAVVKFMALRRLAHLAEIAEATGEPLSDLKNNAHIARLRQFIESTDDRLTTLAMLLLYRNSSTDREKLFAPLLASARTSRDTELKQCVLAALYLHDESRRHATFIELARAADSWQPPPNVISSDSLSSPFHHIALAGDNVENLVKSASESTDVRVRLFAICVIRQIVLREPPQLETLPNGQQQPRYPVPDTYRGVIERAKLDPELSVRAAAEAVDKPFIGPGGTIIPVVG